MNRGAIRAFARLIRRLSCRQLKGLLKKLARRLVLASSGGAIALIFKRKLIKSLKTKIKMVKARIRVKCKPTSSGGTGTGFWGGVFSANIAKLKICKAKAVAKYPMQSGWMGRIITRNKRKAYIAKCMRAGTPVIPTSTGTSTGSWWSSVFSNNQIGQWSADRKARLKECIKQAHLKFPIGSSWMSGMVIMKRRAYIIQCMKMKPGNVRPPKSGFDGEWSNQSGLPLPYGGTTSGIGPYNPPPRPYGPVGPNVPYHTHNMIMEPANIRKTGGPIANPYTLPIPVSPKPTPIPLPSPGPGPSPYPTQLPGNIPISTGPNFQGGVWGDEIDME